jgi:hypothetical protein
MGNLIDPCSPTDDGIPQLTPSTIKIYPGYIINMSQQDHHKKILGSIVTRPFFNPSRGYGKAKGDILSQKFYYGWLKN